MTINQAKNREFEGVILLWPIRVHEEIVSQRRKIYNALTRAKRWAIVIVQESGKGVARLEKPPFSKDPQSSKATAVPVETVVSTVPQA